MKADRDAHPGKGPGKIPVDDRQTVIGFERSFQQQCWHAIPYNQPNSARRRHIPALQRFHAVVFAYQLLPPCPSRTPISGFS